MQNWGYDFTCSKSVDRMLDAFNEASPWHWVRGDSDIYGFYLRSRPSPSSKIVVYNVAEFRTSALPVSNRFWVELYSTSEARPELDQLLGRLLEHVGASCITES